MMDIDEINGRFKDAPWYIESKNEKILITGVGGIGSNALYCLAKTIPAKYYIVDNDTVDLHNIGTQFYRKSQIGMNKVSACLQNIDYENIFPIKKLVTTEQKPITIMGFDNMEARKLIFNNWKSNPDREILIDGRLRASYYEIFTVTKGSEDDYEKTLFDSSEVSDGPCTFKQTAYFAMLIGARITHILVNYLSNKYSGEDICVIPFKVTELGELFNFEAE
jgi:hypothetical protein